MAPSVLSHDNTEICLSMGGLNFLTSVVDWVEFNDTDTDWVQRLCTFIFHCNQNYNHFKKIYQSFIACRDMSSKNVENMQ